MLTRIVSGALAAALAAGCMTIQPAQALPQGFVFLRDIAPTIRQDMRYATANNFMGRRVVGYEAGQCIVTRQAADGLKRAQEKLALAGLTLVMFDCYRPARAVADFMAWTQTPGPADPIWRPNVAKHQLVPDGYIAARSGHSRGSTVDLGIAQARPTWSSLQHRSSPCARTDRRTFDFGTPFDCFDPMSATANPAVSTTARNNRLLLEMTMVQAGFRNYPAEWWHYTLVEEPFPAEVFDFPVIKPR